MTPPRPFTVAVPETILTDLRDRLARARFPDEPPGAGWQYGSDLAYVKTLADYWRHKYDWRKWETELNGFRQFTAQLSGIELHFVHEIGRGPRADAAAALARLAGLGVGVQENPAHAHRPRSLRRRSRGLVHGGGAVAARLRLLLHAGPAALRRAGDGRHLRDPHDGRARL